MFLTNQLKEIKEFSKKIIKFLKYLPKNPNHKGIAQGKFKYRKIKDLYDKRIPDLGEKAVDLVKEGISLALEKGAKRTAGNIEFYTSERFTLTSGGAGFYEKGTQWYYSIRALVDKYATGHKTACGRKLDPAKIKEAAIFASEIAKKSLNPKLGMEGKFDLIFEPKPLANLFNLAAEAASIFEVEAGLSFLTQLNKKIGSEHLTLSDDAVVPDGFGSTAADMEGVPTRRNVIFDKGLFRTYLHNTSTAKRYKTKTTANAGLIAPHPWNIVVEPGDYSKEELFKEVKKGIYITNLWYTRFQNYQTGEFSTIPRDGIFYIENGRIKHPLKEIRIKSSLPIILKNISALSNQQTQIKSWEADIPTFTPAAVIKNINVTRSR
jgi:PmbA protein